VFREKRGKSYGAEKEKGGRRAPRHPLKPAPEVQKTGEETKKGGE